VRGDVAATWVSWEEPDRAVAVCQWQERDICVVFPLRWTRRRDTKALSVRAKARIREVEQKAGRTLVPGSVLVAFSRHGVLQREQEIDRDVSRAIMPRLVCG